MLPVAIGIVIVLALAQVVALYVMVTKEPRRPGTGGQQRLFAALCLAAAIAVLLVQRHNLADVAPLAIAIFFVVDAVGLAISASRQDRRDRADAKIHSAFEGAEPPGDT